MARRAVVINQTVRQPARQHTRSLAPRIAQQPAATPYLFDVNVLISLAWPQHVLHAIAHTWFEEAGHKSWSTCPLTQLAFLRISSNPKIISTAIAPRAAVQSLNDMVALTGHVCWAEDLRVNDLHCFNSNALVGHRQITDAYLIELAKHNRGKIGSTFPDTANNKCSNMSKNDPSAMLGKK